MFLDELACEQLATYQFNLFFRHWLWIFPMRWTDKWMYVVHTVLSSIRGCVKDSRSLLEYVGRTRLDIFFLLVSFLSFISSFVHSLFFFIFSTVHDCAPRAVTLSTRRPLHNLEIYFHLRGILQMNRTSRIDENKANLALALAFEIRYEKKNFSQSFEILTFRLKNKLKARLFDVWFCRCYIQL